MKCSKCGATVPVPTWKTCNQCDKNTRKKKIPPLKKPVVIDGKEFIGFYRGEDMDILLYDIL